MEGEDELKAKLQERKLSKSLHWDCLGS